jgi:hypothetical protein
LSFNYAQFCDRWDASYEIYVGSLAWFSLTHAYLQVVCTEGPERIRELIAMGASFDHGDHGNLDLARVDGHLIIRLFMLPT